MKKPYLKPFNLEQALKGAPVLTYSNKSVTILEHKDNILRVLIKYSAETNITMEIPDTGKVSPTESNPFDLYMKYTPARGYIAIITMKDNPDQEPYPYPFIFKTKKELEETISPRTDLELIKIVRYKEYGRLNIIPKRMGMAKNSSN